MKRHYLWPLVILCSAGLSSLVLVRATRLQGETANTELLSPGSGDFFFFRLELAGDAVGDYSECLGLGSSNEVLEDLPATNAVVPIKRKTPGALEWHNITLKRNSPSDVRVASWRKAMETGDLTTAVRNGAIIMFRVGSAEPIARWEFRGGWVATLRFDGSMEELTIVHEGLDRVGSASSVPAARSRTS